MIAYLKGFLKGEYMMIKIKRAEHKDAQVITDIKIRAYNKEINLHNSVMLSC